MEREAQAMGRFAEVRGTGEAARGLIRVTVDGTGDMVELHIDPRALRLGSEDIAAGIREAFGTARSAARDRAAASAGDADDAFADLGTIGPELVRLGAEAQQRLADFAAVADEVSRRLDRTS